MSGILLSSIGSRSRASYGTTQGLRNGNNGRVLYKWPLVTATSISVNILKTHCKKWRKHSNACILLRETPLPIFLLLLFFSFLFLFFFLEKGIPLCRTIDNKATAHSNHKIRLLYRLQRKQLTKSYRRNLQLPPITGTKYTESTLLLVDYHNDRKFTLM